MKTGPNIAMQKRGIDPGDAPEMTRRRYPLHVQVSHLQKLQRNTKIAGLESNFFANEWTACDCRCRRWETAFAEDFRRCCPRNLLETITAVR